VRPAADHVGNERKRAGPHELDGCAEGVADGETEESAASAVGYVRIISYQLYRPSLHGSLVSPAGTREFDCSHEQKGVSIAIEMRPQSSSMLSHQYATP
jgi:hypothetical protein